MRSLLRLGLVSTGVMLGLSVVWAQEQKEPPKSSSKPELLAKPPQAEPPKNLGTIVLQVPANATVWFGDQKMTQTGTERTYQSPPLEPGKTYAYTIKVSWPIAGGKDYTAEQDVTLRANQTSRVDFRALAGQGNVQPPPFPPPTPQPYLPTGRPVFPRRAYEGSGYR